MGLCCLHDDIIWYKVLCERINRDNVHPLGFSVFIVSTIISVSEKNGVQTHKTIT